MIRSMQKSTSRLIRENITVFFEEHEWVDRSLIILLPLLITIVGSKDIIRSVFPDKVFNLYINTYSYVFWVLFFILIVFLTLLSLRVKDISYKSLNNNLNNLKKEISLYKEKIIQHEQKDTLLQYHLRELFDLILKNFHSDHLEKMSKNSDYNNCIRVSLYFSKNENTDNFIMIGRYCPNPKFNKNGRGYYPKDEGAISECWNSNDGWHFMNLDETTINQREKQYKLKYKISNPENLNMKPHQIAAYRLSDKGHRTENEHIGMLVVETEAAKCLNECEVKDVLYNWSGYLAAAIYALRNHIPYPETAASMES